MSKKKILCLGLELCSDQVTNEKINSKISLLDWDIILIKPTVKTYTESRYQGKPSLSDDLSFHYRELFAHWKREITEAIKHGKLVIVFLGKLTQFYAATGKKQTSGTGRNAQITRIVDLCTNYDYIPLELSPIEATGSETKLNPKFSEYVAEYWHSFGKESVYQVTIGNEKLPQCISTKVGDKTVGAIVIDEKSSGALICLPDLDFEQSDFFRTEGLESYWTETAEKFSRRFISSIIGIDGAIRSVGVSSAMPEWVMLDDYRLSPEEDLYTKLLVAEQKISEATAEKDALQKEIENWSKYKGLLFETGKPLEHSIIASLQILGFDAEAFQNAESEFDVVFQCPEGRFIGEAEGRDSKPISIDKLRQLSMNIDEDLRREEVSTPAKPVLFGNAYRLSPLNERQTAFTDKCISAANANNTSLVATSDLFKVTQYVINTQDENFARQCRLSIFSGKGIVVFPTIPKIRRNKINPPKTLK